MIPNPNRPIGGSVGVPSIPIGGYAMHHDPRHFIVNTDVTTLAKTLGVSPSAVERCVKTGLLVRAPKRRHATVGPDRFLRTKEVARLLGVAEWTVSRWVKRGKFPRPVYLTEHSPATWRTSTIEAFLAKRSVARRVKPTLRGALR